MAKSTRPSFPSAPSEPNLRRLGVGGGGSDRPLRAQLVIAAAFVLILLAVPLYLLRRPSADIDTNSEALASARVRQRMGPIRTRVDAGARLAVRLGPVQRVKCSASPRAQGNEGPMCDALPELEENLHKAIKQNVECAPKTGKEGTVNYVLSVDFDKQAVKVFPGASGAWKGPKARRAAQCVARSLPPIAWDTVQHQYRYYMIAIMATYPAPDPLSGFPRFE